MPMFLEQNAGGVELPGDGASLVPQHQGQSPGLPALPASAFPARAAAARLQCAPRAAPVARRTIKGRIGMQCPSYWPLGLVPANRVAH